MRRNRSRSTLAVVLTAALATTAGLAVSSPVLAQPAVPEVTVSAPAQAAPGAEVKHEVVKYGDLDLKSDAGAKTLIGRLRAAATRVCMPLPHHRSGAKDQADYQSCRSGAIERAVSDVDSPVVSQAFNRAGG